ncbi:MAG: DUF885 domain-containing protein, partial [Shewanella sp.]
MKKASLAISIGLFLGIVGCSDNDSPVIKDTSSTAISTSSELSQTKQNKLAPVELAYLALVDEFFKDYLKLEPIYATFVGVNDYNDQFGGDLTNEYLKTRHDLNTRYLAKVEKIDKSALSPELQLSYDMFTYDRNVALVDETFPSRFMPMNQFYSTVISMVQLGSGESAQPFNTVEDYNNWASRLSGFIAWTQLAQERMDEGIRSKVVLPRVLVERIIPQLKAQLVDDASKSLFYAPINNLPKSFSEAEKSQLTASYIKLINQELIPALAELTDYFETRYLPVARASDGWWGLPNGKIWYQHLANLHTTTLMPVNEIHQIGLSEVARIRSEMDQIRKQVNFKGDLKAFFGSLSSEGKYFFSEPQGLIDGYMSLKDKINVELPKYFDVMPKADYVVKEVESFREQSAAGASYVSPAVDGSRPGVFYIN